ncbi:brain protein I3 isoform X2 [Monodon monoceros]|uniref:brain protein I3 isoform X2 n=1 Tax=Monodon monoceros TaxID=40151 RepID=UPI0010F8FE42|nr:brain protein I3 isoform X2 [Monodon monoceros]XP_029075226.1 brain protein I3 isoform X2 [Monodon monoceros]
MNPVNTLHGPGSGFSSLRPPGAPVLRGSNHTWLMVAHLVPRAVSWTSHKGRGYPRTTPGSTASTAEMSPGTLPIPSLSLEAALSAGSGFWRTPSPSWASSWPSSCSPLGSSAVLP